MLVQRLAVLANDVVLDEIQLVQGEGLMRLENSLAGGVQVRLLQSTQQEGHNFDSSQKFQ